MNLQEIIDRMYNLYVADDGLGRLDPHPLDSRPAFGPAPFDTVFNENGILYRAFAMVKAVEAGVKLNFAAKWELLDTLGAVEGRPGLLNRWPYCNTVFEQHDNYLGACAIARLVGNTELPNNMIKHWWKNWFCFNNVDPGRFSWHQFRQPGEVALYYITAGRTPPLTFVLWMCTGMLIQAFSSERDAAQARLTWLRFWIINDAGPVRGPLSRLAIWATKRIWFSRTKVKYGAIGALFSFGEGHPVTEFQKLIDGRDA